MKPTPTRTIGPLHPEDLEPHRFEDLVRQLVYDFRTWRMLEATGRAGSDDGFDARGYEIVGTAAAPQPDREEDDDIEQATEGATDRLWMIQCKREKSIPPAKLKKYLESIPDAEAKQLHGIIFVAACKFSKAAYDVFRAWVTKAGLAEGHLWGAAEVEDQLFQPKNDHLLFAYFGVSLQTRRRTLKTEVRAKLATKRQCKKHLQFTEALFRDPSDDRYPWLDKDTKLRRNDRGRWRLYRVLGCFHDGVRVVGHRHAAYIADDRVHWDYVEYEDATPHDNPWMDIDHVEEARKRQAAIAPWLELPEDNKAWLEIHLIIPYESIMAIDEGGDDMYGRAHVFTTPWDDRNGPFSGGYYVELETISTRVAANPLSSTRVKKFPRVKGFKGFPGNDD